MTLKVFDIRGAHVIDLADEMMAAGGYLANWSGEHGFVIHSDMKYTGPAHTGDVTYLNGEVTNVDYDNAAGPIANVAVRMTNQNDVVMAKGEAQVQLPPG